MSRSCGHPGSGGPCCTGPRDAEAELQLVTVARWGSVQDWQAAMANSGWGHRPAARETSTSNGAAIEDTGEGTSAGMIRPHPAFYTLAATAPDLQNAA